MTWCTWIIMNMNIQHACTTHTCTHTYTHTRTRTCTHTHIHTHTHTHACNTYPSMLMKGVILQSCPWRGSRWGNKPLKDWKRASCTAGTLVWGINLQAVLQGLAGKGKDSCHGKHSSNTPYPFSTHNVWALNKGYQQPLLLYKLHTVIIAI